MPRRFALALGLCLATTLGGCGSVTAWDPTDLLDFLDTKKKAPGERKPVFPEGVPGISQGVPREMVRGSAEQQAAAGAQAAAAAPPPVEAQPAPPPPKRTKTAVKRQPKAAPVEIAPDDVNVEDMPPARQAQQPRPFPAPLPR